MNMRVEVEACQPDRDAPEQMQTSWRKSRLPFAEWHEVQPVLELLGEIGYSERDVHSALEYLGAEFERDLQGQEWARIKY